MKRIIIIIVLGILAIWFTALVTRPAELPSDVRIIRVLPTADNPYEKEYNELLKPTVKVTTGFGTGSGVIINSEGYVLTAAHVVGKESSVIIHVYDYYKWTEELLPASVVITDTTRDLALIKITASSRPLSDCGRLAPKDYKPYLFTPVYVVGCSLGLAPRPSEGMITAINIDSWEISAPILPGNSGGPVFDKRTHELIGIAVWVRLYGNQLITTMAGIVPINQIYDFLDSHRDSKDTEKILNKSSFCSLRLCGASTPLMNCDEHKSKGETADVPVIGELDTNQRDRLVSLTQRKE